MGPQTASGTSDNVTRCRMLAESHDGGITFGSYREIAQLPDSGCKGSLVRWEAGGAVLASSPDNGGCAAGCDVFCDYKGSGKPIDA